MGLTLDQRFRLSQLDTLVFQSSPGPERITTNINVCTIHCSPDIHVPPAEIAVISKIRAVQFNFCARLDLPATFFLLADMPNLAKLQLKSCGIAQIPAEIWALYALLELNLGNEGYGDDNEFPTLPPEFGALTRLQKLSLHDHRHFRRFPPEVAALTGLTDLSLRGFNALPENTELLPNLKHLDLSHGYIAPQQIIPLLARPNPLQSVRVSEGVVSVFQTVTADYPGFTVVSEQTSMRGNY